MPYKDLDRQKKAQHESYLRNKTKIAEASRFARMRNFQWLDDQKSHPCMDCEQSFPPYVMDFHHRDRSQKICGITQALQRMSRESVLIEIAKCDLLCANCHRIREYGQRDRYLLI